LDQKLAEPGVAFVHFSGEPSASAYRLPVKLRPTRAPCSAQAGHYDEEHRHRKRVKKLDVAKSGLFSSGALRELDADPSARLLDPLDADGDFVPQPVGLS
jgi:hypothetical protein